MQVFRFAGRGMSVMKFLSVVLVAGSWCGAAYGANIVPVTATRSVQTDAIYGTPDSHSSSATGAFAQTASSSGSGVAVQFLNASASQTSSVPTSASAMTGQGATSVYMTSTGQAPFDELADSTFNVTFGVDVTGVFTLVSHAEWSGTAYPLLGFAKVTLTNDANPGAPLVNTFVDESGGYLLDNVTAVTLTKGVTYRLFAETQIDGVGNEYSPLGANGNWSFNLVSTPEPASAGMLGLATMMALRRRGRGN